MLAALEVGSCRIGLAKWRQSEVHNVRCRPDRRAALRFGCLLEYLTVGHRSHKISQSFWGIEFRQPPLLRVAASSAEKHRAALLFAGVEFG